MDKHECYLFEVSRLEDVSAELDSKSSDGWDIKTVQYLGSEDGDLHKYFIVLSKPEKYAGRRNG